jgi:hypothetical protein
MKIKNHNADLFIEANKKQFIGKEITSFETEYKIKDLVFREGEVLALLVMRDNPETPMILYMDVARAAELLGITFDWKKAGFKV